MVENYDLVDILGGSKAGCCDERDSVQMILENPKNTGAFNYDAHSPEFGKLGRISVLTARMNADLHMADGGKIQGQDQHRGGFPPTPGKSVPMVAKVSPAGSSISIAIKKASSSVTPYFLGANDPLQDFENDLEGGNQRRSPGNPQ